MFEQSLMVAVGGATALGLVVLTAFIWEKNSRGYSDRLAGLLPTLPPGYFFRVRYLRHEARMTINLVQRRFGVLTRVVMKGACYVPMKDESDSLERLYRALSLRAEELSADVVSRQQERRLADELARRVLQ